MRKYVQPPTNIRQDHCLWNSYVCLLSLLRFVPVYTIKVSESGGITPLILKLSPSWPFYSGYSASWRLSYYCLFSLLRFVPVYTIKVSENGDTSTLILNLNSLAVLLRLQCIHGDCPTTAYSVYLDLSQSIPLR